MGLDVGTGLGVGLGVGTALGLGVGVGLGLGVGSWVGLARGAIGSSFPPRVNTRAVTARAQIKPATARSLSIPPPCPLSIGGSPRVVPKPVGGSRPCSPAALGLPGLPAHWLSFSVQADCSARLVGWLLHPPRPSVLALHSWTGIRVAKAAALVKVRAMPGGELAAGGLGGPTPNPGIADNVPTGRLEFPDLSPARVPGRGPRTHGSPGRLRR